MQIFASEPSRGNESERVGGIPSHPASPSCSFFNRPTRLELLWDPA